MNELVMAPRPVPATAIPVPPLENGDRLTRVEFERRYEAHPEIKKAELINGRVYVASPVRHTQHSGPQGRLAVLLGTYAFETPGVSLGDNGTVRLDEDNEPQPDLFLRIEREGLASSQIDDGYVDGPPELVAEIAASSVSYDLHDKLHAYRRSGVQEYLVWRTLDAAIDWFELVDGEYRPLVRSATGVVESRVFPGLRLDLAALLEGRDKQALDGLRASLGGEVHREFVARIAPND